MTPPTTPTRHIQPDQGSYVTPAFEHATVLDAMHPGILACTPDTPIVEVARTMATHHVHSVAVFGIDKREEARLVWGIVSDLDLLRAAQATGPETPTAGDIAATEPVTVDAAEPLAAAAQLMEEHEVHHLVVVSGSDPRPVGVLSSLDVAGVIAWGRG